VELMNRWIVPMSRRVDYLSLHTGYKFPVPFDVIVVFSSNLAPQQLADDSFLRRIGYKIHIGELSGYHYETVFRHTCEQFGMAFNHASYHYLLQLHGQHARPLLACYPRDILSQLCDVACYEGRPARLEADALHWAWNNYFGAADGSAGIQNGSASVLHKGVSK
jgi:hypothetical protein